MRVFLPVLLVALAGCATIKTAAREDGTTVSYVGTAEGAQKVLSATDERPYALADKAMGLADKAVDKGMSTSLARDADGDVRFTAGYGYSGYNPGGSVGGYAPGNVGYVPGQGFVVGSRVSSLPPLATTSMVTGVPTTQTSGAIVPCPPRGQVRRTVAEQAACNEAAIDALYQARTK